MKFVQNLPQKTTENTQTTTNPAPVSGAQQIKLDIKSQSIRFTKNNQVLPTNVPEVQKYIKILQQALENQRQ